MSSRSKGRDLYDVWFLLKQDTPLNKELFLEKMEVVGGEVSISISKEKWEQDLEVLLVNPPKYDDVKKEVVRALSEHGFEIS